MRWWTIQHCVNISVYPTYNTQSAVGKPESPRMAPSKWTWPHVLQAGYNDQIYNNSNNNNNVFSRSGATHDCSAATTHQSAAPTRWVAVAAGGCSQWWLLIVRWVREEEGSPWIVFNAVVFWATAACANFVSWVWVSSRLNFSLDMNSYGGFSRMNFRSYVRSCDHPSSPHRHFHRSRSEMETTTIRQSTP